jgi:major membrane immunogen (membrane-anchored lipoprotein)
MKPFFLFCLSAILLSSCSYQLSTHSFYYHGTDALRTDLDFHYIKYGVIGTSNTTYNFRGGGNVREGLVADAKRDMQANFPLSNNQSYANLSVDIVKTEVGNMVDGQYSATSILLKCTISADVIQYGEVSQEVEVIPQNTGSLNSLTIESQNNAPNEPELEEEIVENVELFVKYTPRNGRPVKAKVLRRMDTNLFIEYKNKNGKIKREWVNISDSEIELWKDK